MNTPCKSLILIPIFCFALGGTQSVEAKTCFIVGQCSGDEPNLANTQNCQELGYTKTSCPAGQTLGGARCGDYWEKCLCDRSIYPYLVGGDYDPYEIKGEQCQDETGIYRKYKVCSEGFPYTNDPYGGDGINNRPDIYYRVEDLYAQEHKKSVSGECCLEHVSQTSGENNDRWRCEDYTCNRDYYKYDQEEVNAKEEELGASGIFNIGEDCGDSKGDYLSSISCSGSATPPRGETHVDGVWTSNCSADSKAYNSRYDATVGDVTCHWCYTETCNDVTGGMSLNDCKKGLIYGVNHCVPHETIADCYILEAGGVCPTTWTNGEETCPTGYTQGSCPDGQWCVQKNDCYKIIEKYGCSVVCSQVLQTVSYMPHMRDVAAFLKNLISINNAHAQNVIMPGGGSIGGGTGGGTITKSEYTTYWSEKHSATCDGGEVADCYECEYSGYGVRYNQLYDSMTSCSSSGTTLGSTACDGLYNGFYYVVGNSTINFELDDDKDVGGACYTVRFTTIAD